MGKAILRLDPLVDPASAQKNLLALELMAEIFGPKVLQKEFEVPGKKKRIRKKLAKKRLARWVGQELYKIGYRK